MLYNSLTVTSRLVLCAALGAFAPGLGAFDAQPAQAEAAFETKGQALTAAKRTNGRDRSASSAAAPTAPRSAGSNGRNRGGSTGERSASAEDTAPIALDYAQEASGRRSAGSNGRGRNKSVVADEIPAFDFADVAPEALTNPVPNTRAAQMARYRTARQELFVAAAAQEIGYRKYTALRDLDAAAIAAQFPDGDHAFALERAHDAFLLLRSEVEAKQAETQRILSEISAGADLSDAAIRELHGLLGV